MGALTEIRWLAWNVCVRVPIGAGRPRGSYRKLSTGAASVAVLPKPRLTGTHYTRNRDAINARRRELRTRWKE